MAEVHAARTDGSYDAMVAAVASAREEWASAKRAVMDAKDREHRAFWALIAARDVLYQSAVEQGRLSEPWTGE